MSKSLMQRLIDAGYPKEDMHHWQSDLYVFVTPLTTKIISEWCDENGYTMNLHCAKFVDQITGNMMYDCIFQYYEVKENENSVF